MIAPEFLRDAGVHQGRIPVANAPDGKFVYELGHRLLADMSINVGDYHEVSQAFVMTANSRSLTLQARVVVPAVLPPAALWRLTVRLNNTVMITRDLRISKRVLVLEDLVVSLADALAPSATNTLAVRLQLAAS